MNTKHAPATPLPWLITHPYHTVVGSDHAPIGGSATTLRVKTNRAYIAHAANAYPRLVEALRVAADDLLDGDYETRAGYSAELRALLRELGELDA